MKATRSEALKGGVARLRAAGVEDPAGDAARLLGHALSLSPAEALAGRSEAMTSDQIARFGLAISRRMERRPLSHLVGGRLFWGRWFEVTGDVLDPRPETEALIAAALEGPPPARILDLGVGSGCILATLLAERPAARGVGVDLSAAALEVAQRNLIALGVAERAELTLGDWFEAAEGAFDLIVCNPPYIAADDMAGLSPEVRLFEPRGALTPGGDGLGAYRALAAGLSGHLASGGRAIFEIGAGQADDVAAIFAAEGWTPPDIARDLDGRARALTFRAENPSNTL